MSGATPRRFGGRPRCHRPRRGNSVRRMREPIPQQPQAFAAGLVDEIERYLDAVELFRREGCEPHWRSSEETGAHGASSGGR
jgi:hypothetical protein